MLVTVPPDSLVLEVHSHTHSGQLIKSDLSCKRQALSACVDGSPEGESHEVFAVDVGTMSEEGIGEADEEVLGGLNNAELERLFALLGNGESAVETGKVAAQLFHPPSI